MGLRHGRRARPCRRSRPSSWLSATRPTTQRCRPRRPTAGPENAGPAVATGTRGHRLHRPGPHEPGDLRGAVDQRANGRKPCRAHHDQAEPRSRTRIAVWAVEHGMAVVSRRHGRIGIIPDAGVTQFARSITGISPDVDAADLRRSLTGSRAPIGRRHHEHQRKSRRIVMRSHRITGGGGGTDIHVAETGNPIGRPVLFIHGLSQCRARLAQATHSDLGHDLRLVAMDLRGHGRSERPT